MARAFSSLGWLISSAFAGVLLASPVAMAGDRNGPAGPAVGYSTYDQGRQADQDRYGAPDDLEAVDPCAVHQRVTGLDCGPGAGRGMRTDRRGETWSRSGAAEDLEAVDPCATQYRLTGRGCEGRALGAERRSQRYDDGRGYARSDARVYDREDGGEGYWTGSRRVEDRQFQDERVVDVEEVDPCAEQYRLTGRGCEVVGYEQEDRGNADRPVWRGERTYRYAHPAYDVGYEDNGYVDSCAVIHARMGERCPYQSRERIVEAESLPDTFFFSDGGVGGGIVDFGGGGGGGGGGFAFSDSFAGANANANASASAMASASANIKISTSIMMHNHMMKMMHYPQKMMSHGCGCKK